MTSAASTGAVPETAIDKFSAVLEELWLDYRGVDDSEVVNVDTMIVTATAKELRTGHQVVLLDDEKSALKTAAAEITDSPWNTEGRRRFMLAGLLGEALAHRAIEDCNAPHDGSPLPNGATQSASICMRACKAAQSIGAEGARGPALAAMLLMPDNAYMSVKARYQHDPWMISGYFKVPLEGVDLRHVWDKSFAS